MKWFKRWGIKDLSELSSYAMKFATRVRGEGRDHGGLGPGRDGDKT